MQCRGTLQASLGSFSALFSGFSFLGLLSWHVSSPLSLHVLFSPSIIIAFS